MAHRFAMTPNIAEVASTTLAIAARNCSTQFENIAATPDYEAAATATFDIGANTSIIQTIGEAGDIGGDLSLVPGASVTPYVGGDSLGTAGANAFSANNGQITGVFNKTATDTGSSNDVTVGGIGSNANVAIADTGSFIVDINKVESGDVGADVDVSADDETMNDQGEVSLDEVSEAENEEVTSEDSNN